MSWYKMAQINDWDNLYYELKEYLRKELDREPTSLEIYKYVQKRMLTRDFEDSNKEPIIAAKKDKIIGGESDNESPNDFNKKDLEKGKKIELEHTNDPDIAQEITMDHLKEHKDYYVGLEHMEDALEEIEERAKDEDN